ncbi:MAG TPA: BamA/TamA family outer membrane protein, partial [Rhodospirillaceae bacterium]|nr:BamA/TamA family outer membrane protein [Rhodospirillaceae bacterium]
MRLLPIAVIASLLLGPGVLAQPPSDTVAYAVSLQGVEDDGLAEAIRDGSRLFGLVEQQPPGMIALARRADEDRRRIAEVLRAEGYYDAGLDIAIDRQAQPVAVTVTVDPGQRTRLVAWTTSPDLGITGGDVGVLPGMPAVSQAVIAAEGRMLQLLALRAHPLAKVVDRQVVVDHATLGMTVTEQVDPGPLARFAAPSIAGLVGVDRRWVENRVPWQPGDLFDPAKIEALRKALAGSGLFAAVAVNTGEALDADGRLPIRVTLTERPDRSTGFGVVYSTSEGPQGQAFWEARNLLGAAERLRLTALGGRQRSLLLADWRQPDRFGRDRDLLADVSYERQDTEAFRARTAAVSGGIGWRLSPVWSLSGAVSLEHIDDSGGGTGAGIFDLLSVPLTARRETSDNLLDPASGGLGSVELRPYQEITGAGRRFTRLDIKQTAHFEVLDRRRVILALRGEVGSYLNSKAVDLPVEKRFYAGGGGSLRGYRLGFAGPLTD